MTFPCTVYNRVAADFDTNYPRTVASQEDLDKLGPGWFDDPVAAAAWEPPKLTGPTFEEYTERGYSAESYPPRGYTAQDTPGYADYKRKQAESLVAEEAARKALDAAEVAAEEKRAALAVIDGKILAAMGANDAEEVARLEAEKVKL